MPLNNDVGFQRTCARMAGLLYWVVLIMDLIGMQIHSPAGRSLLLAGSLFTVPLAFGLYYAVRPQQPLLAASAFFCRLLEATLGMVSVIAGYASIQARFSNTSLGNAFLRAAEWDDSTNFAAFAFTIGSTIFFFLFVTSGYIPRILAWWGLFSSVLALSACAAHLIRPAFPTMTMYAWGPMLLAETSTGLWLLLKSIKVESSPLAKTVASRRID